jgi:hypothetical protein
MVICGEKKAGQRKNNKGWADWQLHILSEEKKVGVTNEYDSLGKTAFDRKTVVRTRSPFNAHFIA